MADAHDGPIRMVCEGSGTPQRHGIYAAAPDYDQFVTCCPMCGNFVRLDPPDSETIIEHMRLDVMAMIERGDFDTVSDSGRAES